MVIFSPLRWLANKQRVPFLEKIKNSKILEIGASKSYKKYLDDSNFVIKIDIVKSEGVEKGDVRSLKFEDNFFDVVICFNVLEHVYEVDLAIKEMYRVLKNKGLLLVSVPFLYPLHDKPNDYWRFTEFSLKRLFKDFEIVKLCNSGFKVLPLSYFFVVRKKVFEVGVADVD